MQTALIAVESATLQDERRKENLRKWRARREFQKLLKLPLLPEREVVFGALFFSSLYHVAGRHGYTDNPRKALHILTFRRFLMRFYHLLEDAESHQEVTKRMQHLPTWVGWEDIRKALDPEIVDDVIDIKVRRNKFELVLAVLEADDSILGYVWSSIMAVCILTSLFVILVGPDLFPKGTRGRVNSICVVTFTGEYLVRLICAPFCRRSLVENKGIYGVIAPSSNEGVSYMKGTGTKTARLLDFVVAPMNAVDLISVLPWWLEFVCSTSGFELTFLRVLRLIRLVRRIHFWGLGRKFGITCEVFARSWGSIMAITVTLCLLSLLIGALMTQLEHDYIGQDLDNAIWQSNDKWVEMVGEGGTNAPLAVLWVAGRLTNMQPNMYHNKVVPANWINQVVVHVLGIMKGFVFLLPLAPIKKISTDEERHWHEIDELEYDVVCAMKVKAGEEWSLNVTAWYATVEVIEAGDHEEVPPEAASPAYGSGRLNLPVGEGKLGELTTISCCEILGLLGSDLLDQTGARAIAGGDSTPCIFFEVAWAPAEGPADDKGTLTLTPIEAKGFPAPTAGRRWKLRIHVPGALGAAGAAGAADLGSVGAAGPQWHGSVQFSIDWSWEQDSLRTEAERDGEDLRRLRERLAGQMATLGAIEEALGRPSVRSGVCEDVPSESSSAPAGVRMPFRCLHRRV